MDIEGVNGKIEELEKQQTTFSDALKQMSDQFSTLITDYKKLVGTVNANNDNLDTIKEAVKDFQEKLDTLVKMANEANYHSKNAQETADKAVSDVTKAQSTANEAKCKADEANKTAENAGSIAKDAEHKANDAEKDACVAIEKADQAYKVAEDARHYVEQYQQENKDAINEINAKFDAQVKSLNERIDKIKRKRKNKKITLVIK